VCERARFEVKPAFSSTIQERIIAFVSIRRRMISDADDGWRDWVSWGVNHQQQQPSGRQFDRSRVPMQRKANSSPEGRYGHMRSVSDHAVEKRKKGHERTGRNKDASSSFQNPRSRQRAATAVERIASISLPQPTHQTQLQEKEGKEKRLKRRSTFTIMLDLLKRRGRGLPRPRTISETQHSRGAK